MKKQLTDEQTAARDQRRAAFKEICKKVAGMSETERAAFASKVLAVNPEGHTFSVTNQMLIALQFEAATICGGFNQWKALGRQVKKGEHGIAIWIPLKKKEDPNKLPSEISAADLEDLHFSMAYVFDISQTEVRTQ